jgi:hypothetical protein
MDQGPDKDRSAYERRWAIISRLQVDLGRQCYSAFAMAVAAVLASCAPAPIGDGSPLRDNSRSSARQRTQVTIGWLPEYDAFVKSQVFRYPELVRIPPDRLSNFCPGFAEIRDKPQFYAVLLWAIAGPESDWQRTQITLETNLEGVANPLDPVTGQQVRSEGLLQLSYQDMESYGAPEACSFDWPADRAKAGAEYAAGVPFGDGTRSIHDAYKNLGCALFIVNAHLTQRYPSLKFEDALQRYWVVMNPKSDAYETVRNNMNRRLPVCR